MHKVFWKIKRCQVVETTQNGPIMLKIKRVTMLYAKYVIILSQMEELNYLMLILFSRHHHYHNIYLKPSQIYQNNLKILSVNCIILFDLDIKIFLSFSTCKKISLLGAFNKFSQLTNLRHTVLDILVEEPQLINF